MLSEIYELWTYRLKCSIELIGPKDIPLLVDIWGGEPLGG